MKCLARPALPVALLLVLTAGGVLTPAVSADRGDEVTGRLVKYGRMTEPHARRIVAALNQGLAENVARGGWKYDRLRERVGRKMFSDPGKSREEYRARLEKVLGRMRAGADGVMLEALFAVKGASPLECVTDFPLTMVACDALRAAATQRAGILPYTPPDSGDALAKELVNAGASPKRAAEVVAQLSETMLSVGRTLQNDPRAEELAGIMRACPGSLGQVEAQIRAWNLGPTRPMAACIAREVARRGARSVFAAQLLFGMEKESAQSFLAWGAPSAMSEALAAESIAAGVSVDNVLKVARAHFQAGRFSQAAQAYEQASRMDPSSSRALGGFASAKLRLGDAGAAIQALLAAVKVNATNANLYAMLGEAHGQAGNIDKAESSYRQALVHDPRHARAKASLAKIGELRTLATAKAWRDKGRGHFVAKQYKIAAGAYAKAVAAEPGHAGGYAGLGASKLALGDSAGALEAYRKATELSPRNSAHWTQLGFALQLAGEKEAAARSLQTAMELDPSNARAKAGLKELTSKGAMASAEPSAEESDALVDSILSDPLLESSEGTTAVTEDAATASAESIEGDAAPEGSKDPLLDAASVPAPVKAAAPVAAPAKADAASPAAETEDATAEVPVEAAAVGAPPMAETPSRDSVLSTLKPMQKRVAACAPGVHGVVKAQLTAEGKGGTVTIVEVLEAPAKLEGRSKQCISSTLKTVAFPPFSKDVFQVTFPFTI